MEERSATAAGARRFRDRTGRARREQASSALPSELAVLIEKIGRREGPPRISAASLEFLRQRVMPGSWAGVRESLAAYGHQLVAPAPIDAFRDQSRAARAAYCLSIQKEGMIRHAIAFDDDGTVYVEESAEG